MTPIALDWHDMEVNGMPAWRRAMEQLMLAVNRLESQQSIGLHLVDERLTALEARVATLERERAVDRQIGRHIECSDPASSASRNGTSRGDGMPPRMGMRQADE